MSEKFDILHQKLNKLKQYPESKLDIVNLVGELSHLYYFHSINKQFYSDALLIVAISQMSDMTDTDVGYMCDKIATAIEKGNFD